MNMKYIIAVDLGGTITKVGLLRNGELVDYVKMPSRQDLDMTASLPEIENAIDFLLNSNGVKRLFGVGIAFPGLVNNKKTRVRDKDCVKNRVKRAKIVRFTLC